MKLFQRAFSCLFFKSRTSVKELSALNVDQVFFSDLISLSVILIWE
uniref:Uncharacterized protein n=1 Tax=Anguilla anguilla TaxID=7936 RepID=A0A0E9PBE7_ANGAN